MKVKAPPYSNIDVSFDGEDQQKLDPPERDEFLKGWPKSWPAYRQVLLELFSGYEYDDLLKGKSRLVVEKLIPSKDNDQANLLLRFSFDHSGITWDIFQKGRTIVHAQPVF